MIAKSHAPPTRHTFASPWDEAAYLRSKVMYWFYGKGKKWRARPFAARLEAVLRTLVPNDDSILLQECFALVHELRGDLHKALSYREREIKLLIRWFRTMGPPNRKGYSKSFHDYEDLADRHILVAMLHDNVGDLEKARTELRRAKALAQEHGFKFRQVKFLHRLEGLLREMQVPSRAKRNSSQTIPDLTNRAGRGGEGEHDASQQ